MARVAPEAPITKTNVATMTNQSTPEQTKRARLMAEIDYLRGEALDFSMESLHQGDRGSHCKLHR
jgi:hypothetical protein